VSAALTVADTAFAIAHVRAQEGKRPAAERWFDDPYAVIFLEAGAHAAEGIERFVGLPFFVDGVRLRTRFIDDYVREGLSAGLEQIVILGAGFDARAHRMPEIAARGAAVYEVDLADQLETKRAALARGGISTPPNVTYVPCDFSAPIFSDALSAGLVRAGFRAGAGALFVWEGVISYMDRRAMERTFRFIVRAGGAGSLVVFDFGLGLFDPDGPAAHMRKFGFGVFEDVGGDELWARHLVGMAPAGAEYFRIGVARV
jgi:methyltransferase (TIGR00027 family)